MSVDHDARQLHDRATRGESLSDAERTELEQWYARQDQEESTLVGRRSSSENVASLKADVNAALSQLQTVTGRIQVLSAENDRLRRQIEVLQGQLAQKAAPSA